MKSDILTIPSNLNDSNYDDYADWELYDDLNELFNINNLFSDYPKYNNLSSATPVLVYKTETGIKDIASIPEDFEDINFDKVKEESSNFNELFDKLVQIINEKLSGNSLYSSQNIRKHLDLKSIKIDGFDSILEKNKRRR